MKRSVLSLIGLIGLGLAACEAPDKPKPAAGAAPARQAKSSYPANTPSAAPAADRPVAFVAGQPVTWDDLRLPLTEASGGQILAEVVLDRAVSKMLAEHGQTVTPALVEREQELLLATFSSDANEAQRLFSDVRQRRGLGQARLKQWLTGRAALRLLVQDQVQVTAPALRQSFDFRYGPRYQVRLIVTSTLTQASKVAELAGLGESFIDLAIKFSSDPSKAQGGLIDPLSPADPSYPQAIRDAVQTLAVGQVSHPIALDQGFALLKLEKKIDGEQVKFDDVKAELTGQVRLEIEQLLMQQLARRLLTGAQVTVLDPTLAKSWEAHKKTE